MALTSRRGERRDDLAAELAGVEHAGANEGSLASPAAELGNRRGVGQVAERLSIERVATPAG